MHDTLKISLSDYRFSRAFLGLSQVQMFCIFDVKYGLYKPYFKVLSWWEVASFDFMRLIFEVGGVLEHVISAVCILGIPIPTLRAAEETPGLRTSSAAEQSCCWSHAAASTVAQEMFTPVFPVAAEPGAGAVRDSRLWPLWESRSLVPAGTQPSCLPQLLFTLPSPTCTRSRCHNLLLILLCSVAAPHSSRDL